MKRLIATLLLLTSAVAAAQEAFEVNLADGVSDAELTYLHAKVPWTGSNVSDPLAPMAHWDMVLDPSLCTTTPPPGWGTADYSYRAMNETAQLVTLTLDGSIVDVAITRHAGSPQQHPAVVIAQTSRGTERFTALPAGRTCYGIMPYRSVAYLAQQTHDWTLEGHRLAHRGAAGVFLPITLPMPAGSGAEGQVSTIHLYTAPVFDGPRKKKYFAAVKGGKKSFTAVFRDRDF